MKKLRYDVIVAGGGSAGCAAANVLCKAGLSVALLEAGPDYGPKAEGRWPKDLLDPRFDPDSHDWGYYADRLRWVQLLRASGEGYWRVLFPQRLRGDLGRARGLRRVGRGRQPRLEI